MDIVLLREEEGKGGGGGGGMVVSIGSKTIDLSPSFRLILSTSNSSSMLPPDLVSRVTMINFSITPSSLQGQTLSRILKYERPDVGSKRQEVMQEERQLQAKLDELEEGLLQLLVNSEGNLLEDDKVISALQKIKNEAIEVTEQEKKAIELRKSLDECSCIYTPTAQFSANLYFLLLNLSRLDATQKWDVLSFIQIFESELFTVGVDGEKILSQKQAEGSLSDRGTIKSTEIELSDIKVINRMRRLCQRLCEKVWSYAGVGLPQKHRLALALSLAILYVCESERERGGDSMEWQEKLHSMCGLISHGPLHGAGARAVLPIDKESDIFIGEDITEPMVSLPPHSHELLGALSSTPVLSSYVSLLCENSDVFMKIMGVSADVKGVIESFTCSKVGIEGLDIDDAFLAFKNAAKTEDVDEQEESEVPEQHSRASRVRLSQLNNTSVEFMQHLLVICVIISIVRPDLLSGAVRFTLQSTLGSSFMSLPDNTSVTTLSSFAGGNRPILLLSEPGFDASASVTSAYNKQKTRPGIVHVSVGSEEAQRVESVRRVLHKSMQKGQWVLVTNLHLADKVWLQSFASVCKNVCDSIKSDSTFRLFITSVSTPSLPSLLLEMSLSFAVEAPNGVKTQLQRSIKTYQSVCDVKICLAW
eukprot:gnl/Carplike_NY0171/6617_a9084_220.p1 GENE.gnl/Carplike_NY0171/6617_a9084_220~~gnl/Carplike_NY0171/6617_a9084_220.p1  ORF type:complete len:646 (-),score=193.83 gnl/Carplike_NY0171/6617_a9084_220:32-1969(-)